MTRSARRFIGLLAVTVGLVGMAGALAWQSRGRSSGASAGEQPGDLSPTGATARASRDRHGSPPARSLLNRRQGRAPEPSAVAAARAERLPTLPAPPGSDRLIKRSATPPPAPPPPPKPQEIAARRRLATVVEHHPGTDLLFVNCDDLPCRARVQARDLETVLAAVREASADYQGHVSIKVHEHYETFMGRFYRAEMEVETKDLHPVPAELEAYP